MHKIIKSNCKFLTTKKAYIPNENEHESWRTNKSTTGSYWCIKSMTTIGPDGNLVAPEGCQEHRPCFITMEF